MLASRLYGEQFPDRSCSSKAVFQRRLVQFKQTGSFAYGKPLPRNYAVRSNETTELGAVDSVIENPQTANCHIARNNNNISQTNVLTIKWLLIIQKLGIIKNVPLTLFLTRNATIFVCEC